MSKTIRLSIPGMKCNGCVASIEKAIETVMQDSVATVSPSVDLGTRTATVVADIAPSVLINALKSAGFDATEMAAEGPDTPA